MRSTDRVKYVKSAKPSNDNDVDATSSHSFASSFARSRLLLRRRHRLRWRRLPQGKQLRIFLCAVLVVLARCSKASSIEARRWRPRRLPHLSHFFVLRIFPFPSPPPRKTHWRETKTVQSPERKSPLDVRAFSTRFGTIYKPLYLIRPRFLDVLLVLRCVFGRRRRSTSFLASSFRALLALLPPFLSPFPSPFPPPFLSPFLSPFPPPPPPPPPLRGGVLRVVGGIFSLLLLLRVRSFVRLFVCLFLKK